MALSGKEDTNTPVYFQRWPYFADCVAMHFRIVKFLLILFYSCDYIHID